MSVTLLSFLMLLSCYTFEINDMLVMLDICGVLLSDKYSSVGNVEMFYRPTLLSKNACSYYNSRWKNW